MFKYTYTYLLNLRMPLVLISTLMLASACSDSPLGVEPVDLTVSTIFDEGYESSYTEGAEVTLTNVNTQQNFEEAINQNGQSSFEELPAGVYDLSVILTLDQNTVFELTGTFPDEEEVTFNGTISDLEINESTDDPIVELTAGRLGDLVIKQVYYAGSDIVDGALFRDQFIEIYNNSNEPIEIDGLYIMGAYGNSSNNDSEYVTESGQYDWNQSIGMPSDIDANQDYLYAKWLYQIPDDGTGRVLEPGESVVIAQTALNHKEPFTDGEGETVSVNDPSLTVDLSDADFEVYLGDDIDNPLSSDIDNPNIPNLRNIFIFGRDMILDPLGRDAYVIFKTDEDPSQFESYPNPQIREIRDGTTFYPQIPVDWVIDAVETQRSPSNQIPRKLQNSLDAGYTYVPGAQYSSNSIIRLSSNTVEGRTVLKDTNNSEEDFTFLERAEPKADAPDAPNSTGKVTVRNNNSDSVDFLEEYKSRWARSFR